MQADWLARQSVLARNSKPSEWAIAVEKHTVYEYLEKYYNPVAHLEKYNPADLDKCSGDMLDPKNFPDGSKLTYEERAWVVRESTIYFRQQLPKSGFSLEDLEDYTDVCLARMQKLIKYALDNRKPPKESPPTTTNQKD